MAYPIFQNWKDNKPTVNIFLRIPSGFMAAMLANMGYNMVTPVDESATLLQAVKDKLERVKSKFK